MSDLNTENTRAIIRDSGANIENLLNFFGLPGDEITWENWMPGDSPQFLEELKSGLVALAHVVEVRLQEVYSPTNPPTDFGT